MKNKLTENFLDSFKSVMPITIVVIIISLIIQIPYVVIMAFLISSMFLMVGITFFTLGADLSMITMGEHIGNAIVKRKNKVLILLVSLIMGIVITISEPDLTVFAKELTSIPSILTIFLVAFGVGLYLMIGSFRILKKIPYRLIVTISLIIIMLLLYFTPQEFVAIAFDGGGVTTGAMGVPLIVAFGYGISKIRSDGDAKGDSFGLCGLASLGPVIVILLLGLVFKTDSSFSTSHFISHLSLIERFTNNISSCFRDVIISLIPILGVFIISQIIKTRMKKNDALKIIVGLVLSVIGLTLFLTGVSAGFLEMGYRIGSTIASSHHAFMLVPVGMVMGYIIINAEPAVKILNKQISDLTEGSISDKMINLCMSLGVCLAIGLSLMRVIYGIPMIYIIVPGYFIAGLLMYYTPTMFMTIAFDSGGAASGAMTTSFLLPICIGACEILGGNILVDAFGVGALVSLIPIITIQSVGIIYNYKLKKKESIIFDEEIIDYVWEA